MEFFVLVILYSNAEIREPSTVPFPASHSHLVLIK